MTTRFLFQGVEVNGRTKAYILKRLGRLEKLVDPVSEFEVEIDLDKKGKFRVEVMVKTPYQLYRAEETTESIEGSADLAVDELERQVTHTKDKARTLHRRGGRSLKKKLVVDANARF